MTTALRTVVLLSGRGSNLRAILEQAQRGSLPVAMSAVLSDKADAGGLSIARDLGIPTVALSPREFADRERFDDAMADSVASFDPGLVVLAGYMRILSGAFVRRFLGKLVNIHPSLLPKYPGLHTHRKALAAGDSEHGATVHFVTEELDSGPAILQGRVRVFDHDTEATLSARVQQMEHIIYPRALQWFAEGRVRLDAGQAFLDGHLAIPAPMIEQPLAGVPLTGLP